jgi:hypothetical protein
MARGGDWIVECRSVRTALFALCFIELATACSTSTTAPTRGSLSNPQQTDTPPEGGVQDADEGGDEASDAPDDVTSDGESDATSDALPPDATDDGTVDGPSADDARPDDGPQDGSSDGTSPDASD